MEYIFEDDLGELGSEVEAYCQKCRTEGPHTVITRYEDEVRQVQCGTCGHVHVFKPVRPEATEEEIVESSGGRRRTVKKLNWDEAMRHLGTARPRPYGFRETYRQGEYLDHAKFGKGYVNEVVDDTKIEAVFKDGPRVLVHNRRDLLPADGGKAQKTAASSQRAAARGAAKSSAHPSRARPAQKPRTARTRARRTSAKTQSKAKPRPKRSPPARRGRTSRKSRR